MKKPKLSILTCALIILYTSINALGSTNKTDEEKNKIQNINNTKNYSNFIPIKGYSLNKKLPQKYEPQINPLNNMNEESRASTGIKILQRIKRQQINQL